MGRRMCRSPYSVPNILLDFGLLTEFILNVNGQVFTPRADAPMRKQNERMRTPDSAYSVAPALS